MLIGQMLETKSILCKVIAEERSYFHRNEWGIAHIKCQKHITYEKPLSRNTSNLKPIEPNIFF